MHNVLVGAILLLVALLGVKGVQVCSRRLLYVPSVLAGRDSSQQTSELPGSSTSGPALPPDLIQAFLQSHKPTDDGPVVSQVLSSAASIESVSGPPCLCREAGPEPPDAFVYNLLGQGPRKRCQQVLSISILLCVPVLDTQRRCSRPVHGTYRQHVSRCSVLSCQVSTVALQYDGEAATSSMSQPHLPNPFAGQHIDSDLQQQPQPLTSNIASRYPALSKPHQSGTPAAAAGRGGKPKRRSLLRRLLRALAVTGASAGLIAAGAWAGTAAYRSVQHPLATEQLRASLGASVRAKHPQLCRCTKCDEQYSFELLMHCCAEHGLLN